MVSSRIVPDVRNGAGISTHALQSDAPPPPGARAAAQPRRACHAARRGRRARRARRRAAHASQPPAAPPPQATANAETSATPSKPCPRMKAMNPSR